LPHAGLEPRPRPAHDYAEALLLVAALAPRTPGDRERVRTELLTHGVRTPRVIVLFHGVTNCPAQFDSLGRLLYERGANVLIPRLPVTASRIA